MAVRAVRGAVQLERDEAGHGGERVGARLLAHLEPDRPRAGIARVRPGAAAALRKDIAQ
ncbi:hypothetical protein [Streptomyces misionensis]|uniref:hypothetical protein n=1 Tax=Streptomyces misionensis TaxID=67331 RepID=UPI001647B7E3|nr:hypothetical protein [Streptomyces misionensis]